MQCSELNELFFLLPAFEPIFVLTYLMNQLNSTLNMGLHSRQDVVQTKSHDWMKYKVAFLKISGHWLIQERGFYLCKGELLHMNKK